LDKSLLKKLNKNKYDPWVTPQKQDNLKDKRGLQKQAPIMKQKRASKAKRSHQKKSKTQVESN
jgi:hypothetical protein